LRLAGGVVGALIAIPTIMILSPNFDEIGAYLTAIFIAMLIISYLSTSTTRINYAGLQAGISFILAVATLAPSTDVTEPLWRIWGAILGLVIATAVFLIRPEFSGRALAERMPPFLRAVISLIPANDVPPLDEDRLRALQMYTSRAYQEMLSIAEDARLEGYRSGIDHRAVVDAAANLARIGYRLADVTMDRGAWSIEMPAPIVEARDAFENALRRNLEAWLASFERLGTGASCDIRSAIHPPRYDDLEHAFLALDEIITANHLSEVVELPEAARVALFSDLETYRRITNRARNLDRALRAVVVQSEAVGA